jgi:dienelactone hydrolase
VALAGRAGIAYARGASSILAALRGVAAAGLVVAAGLAAAGGAEGRDSEELEPQARVAGRFQAAQGRWREQAHWVPVQGTDSLIFMRLCLPESSGPARLVVISHGSPSNGANRGSFRPMGCAAPVATWFLQRGYAVAAPLRRGYGASGGAFAETSGSCRQPDFLRAAGETARDILAVVDYASGLPELRADGVVLAGQSAGGWGSLGAAAQNPPRVAAILNMAGGRGGRFKDVPRSNCRPDLLARAAGVLGETARVPSLWVYTENDSFFAPDLAAAMHANFTAAGGMAEFRALPAFGHDGHGLFFARDGVAVWGPVVEEFLARTIR